MKIVTTVRRFGARETFEGIQVARYIRYIRALSKKERLCVGVVYPRRVRSHSSLQQALQRTENTLNGLFRFPLFYPRFLAAVVFVLKVLRLVAISISKRRCFSVSLSKAFATF